MAAHYMCPITTILQYFTDQGVVLNGGQITMYVAGSTTPSPTFTDSTGLVLNSNPIILNSAGRLNNVGIWQTQGTILKAIITDANNNQIGPVFDQLTGIGDFTAGASSFANPASGSGADLVANAMRSYDIFSSMRAANVPVMQAGQTLIVDVQGGTTVGDGLGGLFYWSSSSTTSDDGATVIKPNSAGSNGRYLRQVLPVSSFSVGFLSGSFTGTLNGMTGTVTGTVTYKVTNNIATLTISGSISGTSNATTMAMTGLPSAVQPTKAISCACLVTDSGLQLGGWAIISAGANTINFSNQVSTGNINAFTNTGTKGIPATWCITYPLS